MFLKPRDLIKTLNIKYNDTCIDLGSGSGAFAFELMREIKEEGRVLCIDNNMDLLNSIKNSALIEGKTIDTLLADLNNYIILPDNIGDIVVLANVFNHIQNKDILISEAYRLLSPSGSLLFVDWDYNANIKVHNYCVKKEIVIAAFYNYGFVLDREIQAGLCHFAFIFKK